MFTNLFITDRTPEQHRWWNEPERLTASPENAARTLEALYNLDVSALAGQVHGPTPVMHSRGDARVPFDEGRKLAAVIPGARFVPLESRNHALLENEAAWPRFMAEVRDFLGAVPMATARSLPAKSDRGRCLVI